MAEWLADVFIELVNRSIAASWLVLAVLVLRLLLRKGPKWAGVLLWGLVGFRLVCPFTLESALSLLPSRETVPQNIMLSPAPALNSGVGAVDRVMNPIVTETFAPAPGASANPLQVIIPLLALAWAAGVLVLCLYTLVSWLRLRRRVAEAVLLRDNIFESDRVDSPFVFGILRPRVYLPSALPETARGPVIAHEEAHIARRDHWWKPLGFALLAVYWFNPLLWAAFVLFCRDIELACDERVVRGMAPAQRADYSQALLECSTSRRALGACPLAFGETGVKARVKAALHYKKPAFWAVAGALVLCAVVAVVFLTDPLTPRYDFSENAIVSASVWDYAEPGERELNTSQLDELTGRLEGLRGLSRTSEEGFTPLYALVVELEDGTSLTFNGYKDDGSQVRTEYEGRLWQVTDEAFCAYLYNQWQAGDTAPAVPEPSALDLYADNLRDTVELDDNQILFTLPEEVPEGLQLDYRVAGSAVYEDGSRESLEFLQDAVWTPGQQYAIPYDEAYTTLGIFLTAHYPDGSEEEKYVSLRSLVEALTYAQNAPEINPETAQAFIADVLNSFVLFEDGGYVFDMGPIPVSSAGNIKPRITVNAVYSDEPGTYSTESSEFEPEYGGSVFGRLSGDMDTLTSVSLNVFFMMNQGENLESIYARGSQEFIAPFTFGAPVGYTAPSAEIQRDGTATTLAYTFSDGSKARLSFALPDWLTVDPETVPTGEGLPCFYIEDANGESMGYVGLRPFGATDEPTLETVDTAADSVPMQIFSPAVIGEDVAFADYRVTRHWATGAVATADREFPAGKDFEPWSIAPCVLAYDWSVMPYSVELSFADGALAASAQTEEALAAFAASVVLSAG